MNTHLNEFSHSLNSTSYSIEMLHIINIQRTGIDLSNTMFFNGKAKQTIMLKLDSYFFTVYDSFSTGSKSNYKLLEYDEKLVLNYNNKPLNIFEKVQLLEIFDKAKIEYYKYLSKDNLEFIDDYLIINPLTTCYNNCPGCARSGLFYGDNDYIENTKSILNTSRNVLSKFVYIVTGCKENHFLDREMFKNIIKLFNQAGSTASFGISSSAITKAEHMRDMKNINVIQYSSTIETIRNNKFFGNNNIKSTYNFDEKIETIIKSAEYFEIVDANIMLGYDDPDFLIKKLEVFADTPVTIRYYIPRIYSLEQKQMLNPYYDSLSSYSTVCNYIDTKINKNKLLSDAVVQKKYSIKNLFTRIVGSYNDLNYYS